MTEEILAGIPPVISRAVCWDIPTEICTGTYPWDSSRSSIRVYIKTSFKNSTGNSPRDPCRKYCRGFSWCSFIDSTINFPKNFFRNSTMSFYLEFLQGFSQNFLRYSSRNFFWDSFKSSSLDVSLGIPKTKIS